VYHVELRQFPHNMCRFNLSTDELRSTVLEPWARDRWIELGERKWSPHQATLTVLEGPRIPFGQLTMGRGWRTAQREGREVTAELLAALERELNRASGDAGGAVAGRPTNVPGGRSLGADEVGGAPGIQQPPRPQTGQQRKEDLAADSLGLELLAQIGAEPAPLRRAWELADERHPDSPASATLALAERAVESLLRARLIVLLRAGIPAEGATPVDEDEATPLLGAIASWRGTGFAGAVSVRRA
jgi:hypothetical protein